MRLSRRAALIIAALAVGFPGGPAAVPAAEGPYRQLKEIPIGGDGGWDYLSVDAAARRLYVSHATKVVVVDIDKDVVVGEIAPAPGVHGIAIAPDLGRGFVSNGREATVSIVDLKTLAITGSVKTGENPDAILYEPVHHEVYACNGRGRSATVFDAKTGEVRATIPLPGKPEFAVFDEKAGRVYNNIEDTSQLVAIDSASHSSSARTSGRWCPSRRASRAATSAAECATSRRRSRPRRGRSATPTASAASSRASGCRSARCGWCSGSRWCWCSRCWSGSSGASPRRS
jgi:hypothetical protein